MGRSRLSAGSEMRFRVWLLAMAMVLLIVAFPAAAADEARGQERKLLVHVTSVLEGASDRTVLVFRVIAAGLSKGSSMAVLFDAEGAGSLKLGRWFGGDSTPLDRAVISRKDREDIAVLLGTTANSIPDNYGSLLRFYKGRGLKVYVNQRALELRDIGDGQYDRAAESLAEEKIVELLNNSTAYITY